MSDYTVICKVVDSQRSDIEHGAKAYISRLREGLGLKIWARKKTGKYVPLWVKFDQVDAFREKCLNGKQPDFSNYADSDTCIQCDTREEAVYVADFLALERLKRAQPPQG